VHAARSKTGCRNPFCIKPSAANGFPKKGPLFIDWCVSGFSFCPNPCSNRVKQQFFSLSRALSHLLISESQRPWIHHRQSSRQSSRQRRMHAMATFVRSLVEIPDYNVQFPFTSDSSETSNSSHYRNNVLVGQQCRRTFKRSGLDVRDFRDVACHYIPHSVIFLASWCRRSCRSPTGKGEYNYDHRQTAAACKSKEQRRSRQRFCTNIIFLFPCHSV